MSNDNILIVFHADCSTLPQLHVVKVADGTLIRSFSYTGNPNKLYQSKYRSLNIASTGSSIYDIFIST